MPRLHALELLPDAAGEAAVRRDWQALRDAGLPSMLDHTGASNTPHVTVIAVPEIEPADERLAADLLGPVLPVAARLSGLALLGGRRVSVARLVDVPDELVTAVLRLRAGTRGHQHPGWLPHVTLARRVERADVPRVLEAVAGDGEPLSLVSLRRWDPDELSVHPVVPR
ncbi:2'-5' RNA ligase family protein [Nocardioides lijunqiniae]|uniref:2'-5' RNA ligase family protein n=1 Tax=Nocardioides lijunqiniae TaxID=2760832 RepID=UPI001878816C|nr:2'-5' RNA ligase family protein [Nocardioides lijunqiniae]